MEPLRVVVATDCFRVGGRETFVATLLRALQPRGVRAALLCSAIEPGLPETRVFERTAACPGVRGGDLAEYLERGRELLEGTVRRVLWAQHYDLLPAWLLSRCARVPLVTTFHGPVVGAGRPNDLWQALGMTLAVHRGDALSGVSPEVLAGLASLRAHPPPHLTRNVVEVDAPRAGAPRPAWPPRRLLLVTRDEKLEHLRAGVRLFAAHRRRVRGARLAVVTGTGEPRRGWAGRVRHGLRVLGARWCRAQGAAVWAALPFIDWRGYEPEPRRLMRASDLVLGMGRVLVEGLAEGRPALLVGYAELHGLLSAATFEACAASNFSGRGLPARPVEETARELCAAAPPELPDLAAHGFDVASGAAQLETLLRGVTSRATDADGALAEEAVTAWRRAGTPAALFGVLAGALGAPERESLFRLAAG